MRIFVPGKPISQGSLHAIAQGNRIFAIHHNAPELRSWRRAIAIVFKNKLRTKILLTRPCSLGMTFFFHTDKPIDSFPTGAGCSWAPYHQKVPDLDKLVRAVLDSLTKIAYKDDCQVVYISAGKHWCSNREQEGVLIDFAQLTPANQHGQAMDETQMDSMR